MARLLRINIQKKEALFEELSGDTLV